VKGFTCGATSAVLDRRLPCARQIAKSELGFSLIELMIALAIAAMLAAIGSSYYADYVTSANRTEARAALSATAGSLEKCKLLYGVYNNGSCNVALPITTENNFYSITGVVADTTFVLTATPLAGERQATDDKCTTFTLSQTGLTGATGDDTSACW